MKIVLIEDEKAAVRQLARLINEVDPASEIVAELDSVRSAVAYFTNQPEPELIFTDIQLADGLSFEIFKQVSIKTPLIFTTAFDDYAIQAFKLNSIDYILKPYKKSDVEHALNKYRERKIDFVQPDIAQLLSELSNAGRYKKRFLLTQGNKFVPLETSNVAFFYAKEKVVNVCTRDSKYYICNETLDALETMLDPNEFYRVNRSIIIHRNSMVSVARYFGGRLKLEIEPKIEELVTVSRERVQGFKKWLES